MCKIFLNDFFRRRWREADVFDRVATLEGESFREVKSRHTIRFELEGRGFFLKHHLGVGWGEIFKNLTQFKLPVLGAGNEFAALNHLHAVKVRTMSCAAYGSRNWNPARRESFIITEELANMVSLEELCAAWPERRPEFAVKIALLRELATMVTRMLRSGLNHRDCYICHFLLSRDSSALRPELYVIDLHRAQLRRRTPRRYVIKDLAGIYFSSMDIGITRHDCYRFMSIYSGSLRLALSRDARVWRAVARTAEKLYVKEHRRKPPEIL